MKRNIKVVIEIISRLVMAALVASMCAGCEEYVQNMIENCEIVELGMSREEVTSILGEPEDYYFKDEEKKQLEIVHYESPILSSEGFYCIFDVASGKCVVVHCGPGRERVDSTYFGR